MGHLSFSGAVLYSETGQKGKKVLMDVDTFGLETSHGPVWAGVGVDPLFYLVYLPLVMRPEK
jgi:hypothetical protein